MTAPRGWPEQFPFTGNVFFDNWRLRPSEAARAQGCLAWSWLPRDNQFKFARATEEQTADERLAESKGKTDHGTAEHLLFSQGKLKGQVERFGPHNPAHHEVKIFYDLRRGDRVFFGSMSTDDFRLLPNSRAYLCGTADYLTHNTVTDLKTGKLKEEALLQLAMYAHMAGIDNDTYYLHIWHKRARTDRIYKPEDFGQTNESLKKATVETISKVRTLLLSADLPEPTPGSHCSYCPSRFFCTNYVEGYVNTMLVPAKTLKRWLLDELAAHNQQEF